MKKRSQSAIICCMLTCMLFVGSARAGQVVTDATRSWAKEVLAQEKSLKLEPAPGTVAVLYFDNKSGRSALDPLKKGIALMLITDLSTVKGLRLVERTRIQALVEELGFEREIRNYSTGSG